MDLKKRLELGQTKAQILQIVEYVNGRPGRFKLLVEVFSKGPLRISQRAAWPLTYCVERWPYLLDPHFKILVNYLSKPGVNNTIKRNTVRLLQFARIPKKEQGRVADLCFGYLQDLKAAVAIRVFSMSVLANIAKEHPDIGNEIKLILQDHMPSSSAAFRSRGIKVLRELEDNKSNVG